MKFIALNRSFFRVSTILFLCFLSTIFSGCFTKDRILYFQKGSLSATVKAQNPIKCQQGDILDVKVYSVNNDVVAPFNQFLNANVSGGEVVNSGYLVGENKSITLPLIGQLNVEGLTMPEIESAIENALLDYVKSPVVSVKILNFKITVLGEVGIPGNVSVPNAQANLIEVLGLAGDIGLNGIREDILVIRNEGGKRQEFHLDVTKKDVFDQDGFYLHQNDIIYVAPNATRRKAAVTSQFSNGLFISLITLSTSLLFSLMFK